MKPTKHCLPALLLSMAAGLGVPLPGAAQSGPAQPATAQPAITQPATAQPATAQSATAQSAIPQPGAAQPATDFSAAEQALFLDKPLQKIKPPLTLRYDYRKSGTLEPGFEDTVSLELKAQADGTCCDATPRFFTGPRQMSQPVVEAAQGNPTLMYFLERDIREMQRLTKGQPNYFRKRIRMAVYQGASVRQVSLGYKGKTVAGREISITPYVDDPLRSRYDKLANKQYVFWVSDAVPGGLYGIRTRIAGESADAAPLLVEEMTLDGAVPVSALPPAASKP